MTAVLHRVSRPLEATGYPGKNSSMALAALTMINSISQVMST